MAAFNNAVLLFHVTPNNHKAQVESKTCNSRHLLMRSVTMATAALSPGPEAVIHEVDRQEVTSREVVEVVLNVAKERKS